MNFYNIEPFIWIKSDDNYIFQTTTNTILINDHALSNFLINLEKNNSTEISSEYFQNYFKDKSVEVVNFLLNNKLIRTKPQINTIDFDLKKALFLSNDSNFEYYAKKIGNFVLNDFNNLSFIKQLEHSYPVIYFFLNPFSVEKMLLLSDKIKKGHSIYKFIFTYNNKIYFSNFYKKDWYNPCPRCFFSELESQLRNEPSENGINFQTLLDLIYSKNGTYYSNLPLTDYDYFQIAGIICRDSKITISEINNVYSLDLCNYRLEKDVAYHWGYCDCYE